MVKYLQWYVYHTSTFVASFPGPMKYLWVSLCTCSSEWFMITIVATAFLCFDRSCQSFFSLFSELQEVLFTDAFLSPVLKKGSQTVPDLWKLPLLVLVHCSFIPRSYEVQWYLVGQLMTHIPTPLEWSMITLVPTALIRLPVCLICYMWVRFRYTVAFTSQALCTVNDHS